MLVQRDRDGRHILPGGRREPGEPPEATLRRELLEETGWTLTAPSQIGVLHFHHRDPAPSDHPYPAPDFLQVVYVGRASTSAAAAKLDDGFELETAFLPVAAARALDPTRCELVLPDTATAGTGWGLARPIRAPWYPRLPRQKGVAAVPRPVQGGREAGA